MDSQTGAIKETFVRYFLSADETLVLPQQRINHI